MNNNENQILTLAAEVSRLDKWYKKLTKKGRQEFIEASDRLLKAITMQSTPIDEIKVDLKMPLKIKIFGYWPEESGDMYSEPQPEDVEFEVWLEEKSGSIEIHNSLVEFLGLKQTVLDYIHKKAEAESVEAKLENIVRQ